jgi:hypothetical protein
MTTLKTSIETYIRAKDGNRPHLMADAFTGDAVLSMVVKTDDIAFPAETRGLAAMSDVLVSQFALRYENVYTLCMGTPPSTQDDFGCDWLVCMTEKGTGAARVGYGQYAWHCAPDTGKVATLRITIEAMMVLPPEASGAILAWVVSLPYPWCATETMAARAPDIAEVRRIVTALASA